MKQSIKRGLLLNIGAICILLGLVIARGTSFPVTKTSPNLIHIQKGNLQFVQKDVADPWHGTLISWQASTEWDEDTIDWTFRNFEGEEICFEQTFQNSWNSKNFDRTMHVPLLPVSFQRCNVIGMMNGRELGSATIPSVAVSDDIIDPNGPEVLTGPGIAKVVLFGDINSPLRRPVTIQITPSAEIDTKNTDVTIRRIRTEKWVLGPGLSFMQNIKKNGTYELGTGTNCIPNEEWFGFDYEFNDRTTHKVMAKGSIIKNIADLP